MSGRWTHAICDACWLALKRRPDPIRIKCPEGEICYYCSKQTNSGIYVRDNPNPDAKVIMHEK